MIIASIRLDNGMVPNRWILSKLTHGQFADDYIIRGLRIKRLQNVHNCKDKI